MSAAATIDWGNTPGAAPARQGSASAIDWDSPPAKPQPGMISRAWKWLNAPNATMEKFGEQHPLLSAPMRAANAAGATIEATPEALYSMVRHPVSSTEEQAKQANGALGIGEFEREHPVLRALDPTGGAATLAAGAARGVARNLYRGYEGDVLPEALGVGAGNVAAGKVAADAGGFVGRPLLRAVRRAPTMIEAARTTPEEVGARASGRLEAATGTKQAAIENGSAQQRANASPLYENLHSIDEQENPAGAIQGFEEAQKEFAPKTEKAPRLTTGEAQDLDRRIAAGSSAPTRRQAAAQLVTKLTADGASENDVRGILRDQYGFTSNQANAVMHDAAAPGADGGLTIAKARALRRQLYDAADRAESKENFRDAAGYRRQAGQLTDAMRDRASALDPQGRLLADFDRADAAYAQAREDQRVLRPLTDALEGRGTPSAEKFQKAWDSLTSAQRNALNRLQASGRLDLPQLESGAKTAGAVLKGTRPPHMNWMDRYLKGYLPFRIGSAAAMGALAYGAGRRKGLAPWEREILYTLPMVGYAGAGLIAPTLTRASALEALEKLPETPGPEPGGPMRPSVTAPELLGPRGGTPAPIAPAAEGVTPGREIVPSPRIGPRRQIAPFNGPEVGGGIVTAAPAGTAGAGRELPGMVQRPIRALLPARNVNELPPGDNMIAPGQRLALPPGVAVGTGEPPTGGIRTVGGNVIEDGQIVGHVPAREAISPTAQEAEAAPAPMKAPQRAEVTALENRLQQIDDRVAAARTDSAARKLLRERKDIADKLEQARRRNAKFGVEGLYPPEVIQAAKEELQAALNLWDELPAPERIRVDEGDELGAAQNGPRKAGGEWVGVSSPRGSVEDLYPWVKQFPRHGLSDLREALRKGKGAAYEAWLDAAAKYIEEHGIEGGHE